MALPINTTAQYNLTIPSSGERVKFRPFLVKEEKALLLAQQSEDPITMVETLKDIIEACVTGDYKIDNLATFDLEYIFTQIRGKSVGETVDLLFPCDTCDDEKAKVKISFDITKIQVEKSPEHNKKIELFNDVGVVMRYPTVQTISRLENLKADTIDDIFDIVAGCIDFVYQGDEVFYGKEQTKEELLEFLNNLTSEQFKKIQKFFETMPRLKQEVHYNCPVCGKQHDKVLEGLQSFF
jgi:Zn finger protein HypA/HybF involved in hydrogenase expression